MKVSVVVALFNTGEHLSDLVTSLDRQTLPPSDFEVILVDDGSTDDTLEQARALAAERSNVVVETIPNSGWPGRPRNVGLDRARGDYVFFSDHDDLFAPRALQRMWETARANNADIVYGKVVRRGRPTPYWPLWRADLPVADPAGELPSARTVHKLFRRKFLRRHGLRFLEGKVRLEDHVFMAQALPRARVVSVLASEPCYIWIHRSDGSNSSDAPVADAVYWDYYGRAMQAWRDSAAPGPLLDRALVLSVVHAFSRFSPASFLDRSPERQATSFAALHELLQEHFPPELDAQLPAFKRLETQALRAGDLQRFTQLLENRRPLASTVETMSMDMRDNRLEVTVDVALEHTDAVFADPPTRKLLEGEHPDAELTIRHRASGVEWPLRSTVVDSSDPRRVRVTGVTELDRTVFGTPLEPGAWQLFVRASVLGQRWLRAVPMPVAAAVHATGSDQPAKPGTVSFTVTRPRPVAETIRLSGSRLHITVSAGTADVLEFGRRDEVHLQRGTIRAGAANVDLRRYKSGGVLDFWVRDELGERIRLGYDGPDATSTARRTRYTAYATKHGSLSAKARPGA
jgi:hypothetical protein